ncbi:MAG TPA: amidohydrolase family protein [Streptosporangiaceae bacterium]|jgi:aminocarboxymuconate-semialdehyde decarboxylase
MTGWPEGLIDVHTHAIDPELPDIGAQYEGRFPSVRRTAPDRAQIMLDGRIYREIDSRSWSAAARLRDMDAEDVAIQVVAPIPVTMCHGEPVAGAAALAAAQNDFLARLVAEGGGRLVALGCVPLQNPQASVTELTRCVGELGFAGVEIGTRAGERELADPFFGPFFRAVADLDALVFVHPVDQTLDPRLARMGVGFGLGMPAETAVAGAGLVTGDLLDELPGLRICLAHGGGTLPSALPRLAQGQQLAGESEPGRMATARARRLWCDSLTYDVAGLRLAAQRFGPDHVVLGTDYPFDAREQPAGAVLAEAAAAQAGELAGAARENALALLGRAGQAAGRSATGHEASEVRRAGAR